MSSNPEDMPAVSVAPTRSSNISRIHWLWPRGWRCLWALGLSTTYGLLLLFASLCVATGIFHAEAPHDAHQRHAYPSEHHHAGSGAHHHTTPTPHQTSPFLDICHIMQQVFTPTVLCAIPHPVLVLPQVNTLVHPVASYHDATPYTLCSIRAPPLVVS